MQTEPSTESKTISGRFSDLDQACSAIEDLLDAHVPFRRIRLEAAFDGIVVDRPLSHRTQMLQGSIVGGGLGLVVGVGTVAILGLPANFAALGTVVSASILAGTVAGALTGLGWWRKTPDPLDGADCSNARVIVQGRPWLDRARRVLRRAGAEDVGRSAGPEAAFAHSVR